MSNKVEPSKQILIAGSGPSLTHIDYSRVPENIKVFRINNFFFEDKYYVGKKVDHYLTISSCCENQYFNLYHLNERKEYIIGEIYIVDGINLEQEYPKTLLPNPIVNQNKDFAEFLSFYKRYHAQYVTSGVYSIFLSYMLGYREIYLTGIDCYDDCSNMYPWDIIEKEELKKIFPHHCSTDKMLELMSTAHSREVEIKALNLLKNLPDLKLFSVSPSSSISDFIPLSPILGTKFFLEDKPEGYISDWLPLPLVEIAEARAKVLKQAQEQAQMAVQAKWQHKQRS